MNDASILQAFRHIKVPVMIIGPDGAILHGNPASHQLFGYDPDDLIGRPMFQVLQIASIADLDARIRPPAIDAVIKDVIGQKKGGARIPLAVQVTAWTDAQHGRQHALILRDVTTEIETTRLNRDELARANNAIKGARIGVFEYNPVSDTVIVSDLWREIMELQDGETMDVQVEWRGRVHPDDLATALQPVLICIDGIRTRASCEYRLRSRDGSKWLWMQSDVAAARRDSTGKVIRVIGAMTDISARKTTENDLRRSVEQFRSTFDHASIGKAIVGLDGRWLSVNPSLCLLLGYCEDDLLKTDFQTITHPDDLNADLVKLEQLTAGIITNYQLEKRYIRANGAVMWGLLSVTMVRDAEGNPEHYIAQIVNVTEQRQLNELKRDFVATVSHELRTPLTSVLGALSLLSSMDSEPFSDAAQRLLYIAQENGKRLNALVSDILAFEKMSSPHMQVNLTQNRIAGLIDDAVLANLATADKFDVQVRITVPDRSVTGFVDPKRFQQVMTNLLTNAAKFAVKGSLIDVTVERQPNILRIAIANDGSGIPDGFRNDIFKPFAQARSTTTRNRGGTGLGLSITKQIVELSGGTIGFDSAKDGRTTFWFTVPVHAPR